MAEAGFAGVVCDISPMLSVPIHSTLKNRIKIMKHESCILHPVQTFVAVLAIAAILRTQPQCIASYYDITYT